MKIRKLLLILVAVLSIAAGTARADFVKTKLAVLDFQLQGHGHQTEDMGKIVAEWLVTAFVNEGRFAVIERSCWKRSCWSRTWSCQACSIKTALFSWAKSWGQSHYFRLRDEARDITEVNARIIDVEDASIVAASV